MKLMLECQKKKKEEEEEAVTFDFLELTETEKELN